QKTSSSSLTSDNVAFLAKAKASSSKNKPSQSSGSYSSYTTSSSKATPTATPGLADEVIHSFLATNADDVDLEEMDINWQIAMTAIKIKKFYKKTGRRPRVDGKMHVAFDKRKVECFNCHNTGHFARECKFKGSKEGSRQEAGRNQNFKPVQTEKEALMTIDEGQINWVEQTEDEELNHALMAQLLRLVEYKGVPHPLSGDYTPREQEDIDDSLYVYGKYGPQPQCPSPTESATSSTAHSTCQSNDSDGELGDVTDQIPTPSIEQVTIATPKTQPQVSQPKQTVVPSCAQHVKPPRQPLRTPQTPLPINTNSRHNWNQQMERELGAGYSFQRKTCFVCGSLSHLIKDCDYYEKKMAIEDAFKSKKVVHANVRPIWTNTNRVNKANQFTPRPVQLSNFRPNLSTDSRTINTGRVNVNTARVNVNTARVDVNTGHGNVSSVSSAGTHIKSGSSRVNTGKQNINSGSVHINIARVNRPVSNQTFQVNFKSPKQCFSKQSSPVTRPFSRNTAYKSHKYAVKGKVGTAVKTSAGALDLILASNMLVLRSQADPKPVKALDVRAHGLVKGHHILKIIKKMSKVGSGYFWRSKGSISGKGTDNQEKDEKQSQNDKTGLGMEKTVKDKAKSKPESQSSQKVNRKVNWSKSKSTQVNPGAKVKEI
ncbi:ribonuclease H-like domain-containing protein, partial [Tanacetum coccineum]